MPIPEYGRQHFVSQLPMAAGKPMPQKVPKAIAQGKTSGRRMKETRKATNMQAIERSGIRIALDQTLRVFDKANAEEKDLIRPYAEKKLKGLEKRPDCEQRRLRPRAENALAQ
jgi:hypothetical protein